MSNPPYVRAGDIPGLAPDVRLFEPVAALDGGRRRTGRVPPAGAPGGPRPAARRHAAAGGGGGPGGGRVRAWPGAAGFALVAVHKDLSRKDRMVEATLPGAARSRPCRRPGAARRRTRCAAPSTPAPSSVCRPTPCTASPPGGTRRPGSAGSSPPSSALRSSRCGAVPFGGGHQGRAARPRRGGRPGAGGAAARALHVRGGHRRCRAPSWSAPPIRSGSASRIIPICCACWPPSTCPWPRRAPTSPAIRPRPRRGEVDPLVLAHCSVAVVPPGRLAGRSPGSPPPWWTCGLWPTAATPCRAARRGGRRRCAEAHLSLLIRPPSARLPA